MQWRTVCLLTLALGLLSLLAVLGCNMALIDIYHGERDVTLEWNIVRISFLIIVGFQVSALTVLWHGYQRQSFAN